MDDRAILAQLMAKMGITKTRREEYDGEGRLILLDLSGLGITYLDLTRYWGSSALSVLLILQPVFVESREEEF